MWLEFTIISTKRGQWHLDTFLKLCFYLKHGLLHQRIVWKVSSLRTRVVVAVLSYAVLTGIFHGTE